MTDEHLTLLFILAASLAFCCALYLRKDVSIVAVIGGMALATLLYYPMFFLSLISYRIESYPILYCLPWMNSEAHRFFFLSIVMPLHISMISFIFFKCMKSHISYICTLFTSFSSSWYILSFIIYAAKNIS